MNRILLIGKDGQIGWELQRTLAQLGEVVALGHTGEAALDLTNPQTIRNILRDTRPDLVVNAAAYTNVDHAENEPELALSINGHAPGVMAEEAKRLGALMVHYSTDYVFDGTKEVPYTEDDTPNPINVYGRSKLAGEQAIQSVAGRYLIFRTSWVYGLRGNNFLTTIRQLARERGELRIVSDQIGAPTWSRMIAETTAVALGLHQQVRQPALEGVFHLTASGATSWFGFASAILESEKTDASPQARLTPIKSSEYPSAALRPLNSLLDNRKLMNAFGIALPDWLTALGLCLEPGGENGHGCGFMIGGG